MHYKLPKKMQTRLAAKAREDWYWPPLPGQGGRYSEEFAGIIPEDEKRIAVKLLENIILEASGSELHAKGEETYKFHDARSRSKRNRLRDITQTQMWMNNMHPDPKCEGYEYTFEHWCAALEVDSDYMFRKLREFLAHWAGELRK